MNEIEIHVTAKDDTGKVLSEMPAKAKKVGATAGDEFSGSFSGTLKSKLDAAPPVKIKADLDDNLAKAKIEELSASKNAAVIVIDADVAKAQARIKDLEDKRGKTKLDVDAEIAKAKAKIDALLAKRERVVIQLDVDTSKVAQKAAAATGKMVEDVDKATDKVTQGTQAKFSAMQFLGLSVGLPAAALAGAVGAGAVLAAVPLLFTGIGIAAVKNNAAVADSFGSLKDRVVSETAQMAAPMEGTLVTVSGKLGASFSRLEPQIKAAMAGSTGGVLHLTDGVTKLAENAMPGLVTAVRSSDAPMRGLESLLSNVGAGVSDMFGNLSKGSTAAGQGLQTTGGIVRDLLGFTGSLFANLANGSSGPLRQFQSTLGLVESTALSLTSNGMPALQGTTSGFLNVVTGGIGILKMGADALGSWTQPLGALGGSLLATNSVSKLFGTSLGETGFGLKAFATSVDDAGNKTSPFKTALADAEKNGTSKLKAGATSLLSAGINPLGIALIGGGLLLDAFGQSQQKAAEAAAAHRENVRTLTDAIRQDNGTIGQNAQAVNAKALADKNASSNLSAFGQTLNTATSAINGNGQAYDALRYSAAATLVTVAKSAGATTDQAQAFGKLAGTSLETGKNYEQLRTQAEALLTTSTSTGDATIILSQAQRDQVNATLNATGAVGEQIRAQLQAHDAYVQAEMGLSGLSAEQVKNRDATIAATQAIYEQQNQALGYRGAVLSTQDALLAYTKVSKDAKATELDREKALLGVERAFASQEQAAYNAAFANSKLTSDSQKAAEATAAMDRETVKLANTVSGVLPQSMQQTISKFNVAEAQAAGLTVAVNRAGDAVYRLPNGKDIRISADTGQAVAALAEVKRYQDSLYNKTVAYTINIRQITSGQTAQAATQTGRSVFNAAGNFYGPSSGVGFAAGGFPEASGANRLSDLAQFVPPGTLKWVGDADTPELFAPLNGSKRTKDLLLRASQHEGLLGPQIGMAAGGLVQAEDGSWVPDSFYGEAPKGPHAIYTASGFAKVRAEAMKNGIGTLSAKDQDQLRTYDGWVDPPAPSSSASGSGGSGFVPRSSSGGAPVVIELRSSGSDVDNFLLGILRKAIRVQGGNVQVVLGT